MQEFPLPPRANPSGLVVGPDGNFWFTETHNDRIGRMSPAGVVQEYALPLNRREPVSITAGPDRALWFTFYQPGAIGRIDLAGRATIYDVSK
jgi:virginiamycin B lyase